MYHLRSDFVAWPACLRIYHFDVAHSRGSPRWVASPRFRYTVRFVKFRASLVIALFAFLAGCSREPVSYPPPIQRLLPPAPEKKPLGRFVNMNDLDVDDYIVGGIQNQTEGAGWRWTHEAPELRFMPDRTAGLKFVMDLGLPAYNFQQTGPVTLSFFINGKLLDRVRYDTPGDRRYEKPVPAGWLKVGELAIVRIQVDPPWISESDQAKLGFVLHRAGFVD